MLEVLSTHVTGRSASTASTAAVVRLGRRHGVPVPANQALYALLGALA